MVRPVLNVSFFALTLLLSQNVFSSTTNWVSLSCQFSSKADPITLEENMQFYINNQDKVVKNSDKETLDAVFRDEEIRLTNQHTQFGSLVIVIDRKEFSNASLYVDSRATTPLQLKGQCKQFTLEAGELFPELDYPSRERGFKTK